LPEISKIKIGIAGRKTFKNLQTDSTKITDFIALYKLL
jgi:hypothetical protein